MQQPGCMRSAVARCCRQSCQCALAQRRQNVVTTAAHMCSSQPAHTQQQQYVAARAASMRSSKAAFTEQQQHIVARGRVQFSASVRCAKHPGGKRQNVIILGAVQLQTCFGKRACRLKHQLMH